MNWKRLLACVTGSVNQELLLRNEYLAAEMARNATFVDLGLLGGCRYLLHGRDAKFRAAFDGNREAAGIQVLTLPPWSPNLNAHLERWNRSVKEECLSKLILFGESPSSTCCGTTPNISTPSEATRGKAIGSCFLRRWTGSASPRVRSAPGNAWEGCCGSTTERPHEHFDHTG
jgi:hypothetical protein